MHRISEPYVPATVSEIMNLLGSMMLGAPTFQDKTGYFLNRDINTEFSSLNSGLEAIRGTVGDDNYLKLAEVSGRMRSHFEAGLKDRPEEVSKGRRCIEEMEDILRAANRRKR